MAFVLSAKFPNICKLFKNLFWRLCTLNIYFLSPLPLSPSVFLSLPFSLLPSLPPHRASYFSPNPTDKMYTIVAAAKALYDQLGMMGEMSIDGDSFLDLWIYIILKANIKDLVGVVSGCGLSWFTI